VSEYSITIPDQDPGFDHVQVIGQINLTQMYSSHGDNFNNSPDPYFETFKIFDPVSASLIEKDADYFEVRPLKPDIMSAFKKNDQPYTYPSSDNPSHALALEFADYYLSPILSADVVDDGEELEYNVSSSSGIIGKKTGFPHTADYLKSAVFERYKDNIDHIPLQLLNDKNEFLSKEDIARRKVRLVDCVDKTFLRKQKKLYQNQNANISNESWKGFIKYGFVKQYGGFDSLVTSFEKCRTLSISDVSGYDKASVLKDVYRLRNKNLRFPKHKSAYYVPMIDYVTFYTLNPIRVLFNGLIVLLDHSNSSGQNNTATDNSILHVIIVFNLILSCYFHVFSCYPTYKEFLSLFHLVIYSDDKVLGLNFEMCPDEFKLIEISKYLEYGMTIKPSASVVFNHPGGLFLNEPISFLGSDSKWSPVDDCYLPVPRIGKLCSSLCRRLTLIEERILDPVQQFSKAVMILSLLFGVDENLRLAVLKFINFLGDSFPEHYTDYKSFLDENQISGIVDTNKMMKSFDFLLTGRQSSRLGSCSRGFNFFPPWNGNEVGFNKFMSGKTKQLTPAKKQVRSKPVGTVLHVKVGSKGQIRRPTNKQNTQAIKTLTGMGAYKPENGEVYYQQMKKMKRKKKQKKEDSGWLGGLFDGIMKIAPHILPLIAGFGDYDISMNSLMQDVNPEACSTQVPIMSNSKNGNIARHREFIGVILSTTSNFSVQTFDINPGLDDLFPWLSVEASGYTSYRMRGLIFEFKTRATSYSATPSLGYVAFATNYDSLLPAFGSERELLNYEFATSCAPNEHMIHPVECARDKVVLPQLYLRSHAAPDPSDKRMYDMGKFNVAVGGQPSSGAVLGELWASFEVELLMPKLAKDSGKLVETDSWDTDGAATNPFGTTRTQAIGSTFTGTMDGDTYLFPLNKKSGFYLVTYTYNMTAAVTTAPVWTLANCAHVSGLLPLPTATNPVAFPNATGTSSRMMSSTVLRLTGAGQAGFDMASGAPTVGSTDGGLTLTQLPDSMFPQPLFDDGTLTLSDDWFKPPVVHPKSKPFPRIFSHEFMPVVSEMKLNTSSQPLEDKSANDFFSLLVERLKEKDEKAIICDTKSFDKPVSVDTDMAYIKSLIKKTEEEILAVRCNLYSGLTAADPLMVNILKARINKLKAKRQKLISVFTDVESVSLDEEGLLTFPELEDQTTTENSVYKCGEIKPIDGTEGRWR
jgi:hypothetical protein